MKSSLSLRLLVAFLLLFITFSRGVSQSSNCKEIKAKVVVTDSTPGNDDGKIEIEIEKGPSRFRVCVMTMGLPKVYNNTHEIKGLRKGKHVVVVGDMDPKSDFCQQSIEVTVK
jgi:hypothetical protein